MADSSSDDELPLAQRPVGGVMLGGSRPPVAADSSDESDIPSWLQGPAGAKGKGNQVINLTDSDSDDGAVLSPPKPAKPAAPALAVAAEGTGAAAAAQAAPAEPAGNRDTQQLASQPQTQPPATQQQPPSTQRKVVPGSAGRAKGTPRGRAGAAGAGQAGTAAAAAAPPPSGSRPDSQAQPTPQAGPSSQLAPSSQAGPSSQAAPASQAGGTAQKRGGAAVGLPHAPTNQMAVVLPDKLPQIKMLVELESGGADDTHGVTDLSGDSGAIGRLLMGGTKEAPQMQVDLKGVLYNATIVPCPMSLAVINMGVNEAKVECLFSEFVQLREDTRFSFTDGDQLLMDGDDEEDVFAGGPEGAGEGEGGAAPAAKKGRGGAAAGAKAGGKAGAAKAAPRKRAAPKAKGGVKKGGGGTGKARAKPKPKPKAAAAKKK